MSARRKRSAVVLGMLPCTREPWKKSTSPGAISTARTSCPSGIGTVTSVKLSRVSALRVHRCGAAKPDAQEISDAEGVLELLWLLLTAVLACVRPRQDLVLENLLLRHQLAVLTRPTRTPRRARLRVWERLLWVLARRWCTR